MSKEIRLGILYSGQLETQLIKSAKKNWWNRNYSSYK